MASSLGPARYLWCGCDGCRTEEAGPNRRGDPLPASKVTTIPKARGKWSTTSATNTTGSITRPVTTKKLGMNKALPKNSSLTLAGSVLYRAVGRQSRQERADGKSSSALHTGKRTAERGGEATD
jgi:hypothetical protein